MKGHLEAAAKNATPGQVDVTTLEKDEKHEKNPVPGSSFNQRRSTESPSSSIWDEGPSELTKPDMGVLDTELASNAEEVVIDDEYHVVPDGVSREAQEAAARTNPRFGINANEFRKTLRAIEDRYVRV